jgi:hypothetical protein
MKKIIKPSKSSDLIYLEEVFTIDFPNVGIHDNGVSKGFLVPEAYYDYGTSKKTAKYFARAVRCFSKGNGWGSSETRTLEDWTKFFGETTEFYLFDNPEELFLWLSRE